VAGKCGYTLVLSLGDAHKFNVGTFTFHRTQLERGFFTNGEFVWPGKLVGI
jgi:hypothetical protein